jgi:hypothetical protein
MFAFPLRLFLVSLAFAWQLPRWDYALAGHMPAGCDPDGLFFTYDKGKFLLN